MSSNLSVTFLGTGASWPTAERGSSAIAVVRKPVDFREFTDAVRAVVSKAG